jgi:hypothetical protein
MMHHLMMLELYKRAGGLETCFATSALPFALCLVKCHAFDDDDDALFEAV